MSNKIRGTFDDYTPVDCNDCSRYWDDSCDGVTVDSERPCNSFSATRKVVIPQQIKSILRRFWLTYGWLAVLTVLVLIGLWR